MNKNFKYSKHFAVDIGEESNIRLAGVLTPYYHFNLTSGPNQLLSFSDKHLDSLIENLIKLREIVNESRIN